MSAETDGGDREILALSRAAVGDRVRVVHLALAPEVDIAVKDGDARQ